MRRASLRSLQPGAVLAKAVYNERGAVLLTAGTELTQRYLRFLIGRGTYSVFVEDPDTDGIEVQEIISDGLRAASTGVIHHAYQSLRSATASLQELDPAALMAAVRSPEFRRTAANVFPFDQLVQIVDEIINEISDARILTGMAAIKSYDNYTFAHSVEMATIAIVVGRKLRLDKGSLKRLARGCLLHDIGKIFIDDTILNKAGPLTEEELRKMRQHTVLGYELLQAVQPGDVLCNNVAFQHHERQDGRGYPRGLSGLNRVERPPFGNENRILLIAEIAAIADVYDALASDRPYRAALAPELAISLLREQAGSALNRELVDCFLGAVPVFPVGMTIRVTRGQYEGFRGVVAHVFERDLARPVIRVFQRPDGEHISPMELDLRREKDLTIVSVLG